MERPSREKIRESLMMQMQAKGMVGDHFADMAEDYMAMYDLKAKLLEDIETRGTKVETPASGGRTALKTNESLLDMLKVNKSMVDMLKNLGLNNPDQSGGDDAL